MKIQFLTMVGCHDCAAAKKVLNKIIADCHNIEVEDIDDNAKGAKIGAEICYYGIDRHCN